jgi:thiol-disulfide isomerase/thioredoxin
MRKRDRFMGWLRAGRRPTGPRSVQPEAAAPGPTVDVRLADLAAIRAALVPRGRPLLVNHWATWCEGCVEELPALVALAARTRDRADFVGIGWELFSGWREPGPALAAVAEYAADEGLTWPTLVFDGEPEDLFAGLGLAVPHIPQTFLLAADGGTLLHFAGALGSAEIAACERAVG